MRNYKQPGNNQFKSKETFCSRPKISHEWSHPETCSNVISYRRDDSRPDGSIELCRDDDVKWAHTASLLRHRITDTLYIFPP